MGKGHSAESYAKLAKTGTHLAVPAKAHDSRMLLLILFSASFVIHTILNIVVNEAPTVIIDEGLYTNIARSLAWDGELAFRGQPVNYPYLLYPFLLVPVYWLNGLLGGDIYRYIQVFNTLLITTSVFPAYLFALDFTRDEKKSLIAALIVALMPDMLMGGYTMAESLIWPLSLWMVFFCYRFYSTDLLKYGLLTALFTGLLFAAKPGAIAAGGTMMIVYLSSAVKNKKNTRNALYPLVLLAVIIGLVYAVYLFYFHSFDSLLGLYTKQTSEWKPQDILVAGEAILLLLFLFVFACGGVFGIIPFSHFKLFDQTKRKFIFSFAIGLMTVIIGTAVFVVPYKWDGSLGSLPLHLRYCSMFVPIMFIFSIDQDAFSKSNRFLTVALILFIILSIFPGARAGFVKGETGTIDSMALGAFLPTRNLEGTSTGWILTIIVVLYSVFLLSYLADHKPGKKRTNKIIYSVSIVYLVIFTLFNTVCAYISANIYIEPAISADAREVNELLKSKEALGVTQRYYDDIYSYWLDGRLTKPMQQVTIDQMFVKMEESNGVYHPFVPVEQAPNIHNHKTPETDTIVLGQTIAEHLVLSDHTSSQKTKNGYYTVVTIEPDMPWVDSMMYGLNDNTLQPDTNGYIRFFNESLKDKDGNVTIRLTASGSGTLNIGSQAIELTSQAMEYEITLPYQMIITMKVENGSADFAQYEIKE